MKTTIAAVAILAFTGFAQAEPTVVEVEAQDAYQTNLRPGYSDAIDLATVEALDSTVQMQPEFERPNNFMSDEGVYRYAYYEKTGTWLTLDQARKALKGETPVEHL